MLGSTFPPFPDDVRTHPFFIIDYELIKAGDVEEVNRLWEAATTIGFWYLKNHGADQEVSDMFDMGAEAMALPLEERMKFEQGVEGQSFGYKKVGANAIDATGTLDAVQFLNVSKDDALAYPQVVQSGSREESGTIELITERDQRHGLQTEAPSTLRRWSRP